jgi:hypothetical protein
MPEYVNLPIITELQALVKVHEKKPLAEHDAKKAVLDILNKYVKLGKQNAEKRLKFVTDERDSCKKTLARMEALLAELKNPDYIPEMYKLPECKAGLDIITLAADAVHKDATTMYDKMGEFRANWTITIAKLCKDTSFVNSFITVRTGTMMLGTQATGLSDRIDEYKKRAALVADQAMKARQVVAQSTQQMLAEAKTLAQAIETAEATAAKGAKAADDKVKSLTKMKTQSVYTGKEHRVAESFVTDVEKERKSVAGQHKTATQYKTELLKMIQAKAFLMTDIKKRMETAIGSLDQHLASVKKDRASADTVFAELAKRLKK